MLRMWGLPFCFYRMELLPTGASLWQIRLPHLAALVPIAFGCYIANERSSLPLMRERWLPHLADWYLSFDVSLWQLVALWLPSLAATFLLFLAPGSFLTFVLLSCNLSQTLLYTLPITGRRRFHIRPTCLSQVGVFNLFHVSEMFMGDPSVPLAFRLTVDSNHTSPRTQKLWFPGGCPRSH